MKINELSRKKLESGWFHVNVHQVVGGGRPRLKDRILKLVWPIPNLLCC